MIKKTIAVLLAMLGLTVQAATDSTFENSKGAVIKYNSKGEIVRGEWTSQYNKAKKQAEAEGVPLVIFWANDGCGHCASVEVQLATSGFKKWMKEQKLYMVFTCGGYHGPCGKTDLYDNTMTAKADAKDPSGQFPYIGVYWNNGGDTLKKRGTFTGNGMSASQFENAVMKLLRGYKPSIGGWFADAEQGESRYEVEAGVTKQVELILTRDSKNKSAGDDTVKVGSTTYKVKWEKNATTASLVVDVPAGLKAGESFTAVINDEKDEEYNCTVHCVAPKANSAGNPAWKGETFAFGKWTADFVTATNKVATFVGGAAKAYTLVSVQGSLWCPDCANTERNFLDLEGGEKFKAWAREKHIALVSVDIPNYSKTDPNGAGSPSLFTRTAAATTLARAKEYPQSGADASLTNAIYRSGLSYMTRKGISSAAAAETAELFKSLVQKNTDEGGFNRPEDNKPYRTGVPIFVLLRKDGTVAARLTRFGDVSPMKADQANFDNYIKRFNEMLAIADNDPAEIENNYPSKDSIALKLDETVADGEISNTDFQDSFKLEGNGAAVVEATVSGSSAAEVVAQFMQMQDGKVVNVGKSVTGKISSGFKVTGDFQETGACYLLVKGKDIKASEFKVESAGSTLQAFKVSAKATSLNPQQAKSAVPVKAGESISLNVTSGTVYRIVGATPREGYFIKAEGRTDLYEAQVDGAAPVDAESAGTLEYQEWVPATVGFSVTTETKNEDAGTVKVLVMRTGGVSGEVKATVALNTDATTLYYDHDDKAYPRFVMTNGQTGKAFTDSTEFVWADGDDENKEILVTLESKEELPHYYGDGDIALKITGVTSDKDDAGKDKTDYVMTVKETSKNTKCKISVVEADPAWIYKPAVYARKGEGVEIELNRSDVGDVNRNYIIVKSSTSKAVVKAGEGNTLLKSGKQYWETHDYTNKLLKVDLGKMSAGSSATITLTEKKDSKKKLVSFAADSSSKQVKIYAVADDAPAFVTNKVGTFNYVTYSYVKESVEFDTAYVERAKNLSVKLVKGSLPSGVKASVSDGKLYFKGIPTKAGSFTAYYQAQEKRGTKTVKGLVVKASFRIVDPTTVKSTDAYAYLANTAVKSSRSLKTLPVLAKVDGFYRVVGTLNVTLPKSGKISAKFTGREATVSFSATRWAKKNFEDGDGTLSCTMTKSGYTLTIEAYPDYTVVATISNEAILEQEAHTITLGKVWSSKSTAKAWKGIYNAALVPGGKTLYLGNDAPTNLVGGVTQPTATNENGELVFKAPEGYGYVNFKMTTKTSYEAGKMAWAGKLPNGQKISGTAYLTKGNDAVIGRTGYAYLPIFQRLTEEDNKSKDIVALVAEIQDNAATEGGLRYVQGSPDLYPAEDDLFTASSNFPLGDWEHTGVSGTGTDYGMDLHLFGSYYDPKKDLRECCAEQSVPTEQLLQFETPDWVGSTSNKVRCEADEIAELDHLKVGKNTIAIDGSAPNSFSISLDRDTGVLSGKVRVYTYGEPSRPKLSNGKTFVEATWTGVMTTGWGADCGCMSDDSLTLPFICGALSFKDEISYWTAGGTTKIVKQLSGGSIYSGGKELGDK